MSESPEGWTVYTKVLPAAQLSQGDLIAFDGQADPVRRYALVVTADCDLAQRKHARLLTVVPVVELRDLVERYLLLEQCDKIHSQISAAVARAFDVPADFSIADNIAELRIRIEERQGNPAWSIPCLAGLLVLHEVERLTAAQYRDICSLAGCKSGDLVQKMGSQVRAKGDILLLPPLRSLGITADIAWVRQIWQVPVRDVVFKNSEASGRRGQRVARLDSPYRYRLTQLLGQVFSDIGLPDRDHDVTPVLSDLMGQKNE